MRKRLGSVAFGLLLFWHGTAEGQSLMQRTPNISGGWEAAPGTLYFNFLHRFVASDPPQRKVSNVPTFLLGAGLPGGVLVAANYSTASDLVAQYPNEWEFFARVVPFNEFRGFPVDLSAQGGYNLAAESFDFELNVAKQLGPVRVLAAGRALTNGFGAQGARYVVAAGALARLNRWLALGADVAQPTDKTDDERTAWSYAVQVAIPYTPHTLSLQASNTSTSTLQGSSRASTQRINDKIESIRRYGFEFTIPVNLGRYFGRRPETAAAPPAIVPSEPADTMMRAAVITPRPDTTRIVRDTAARVTPPVADTIRRDTARRDTARTPARPQPPPAQARPQPQASQQPAQPRPVTARMRQLNFEPRRVQISAGTTVIWRNDDQVVHTVKAADGSWESPNINPGSSYRRTFNRPGRYEISCGPHPFMKQTIEVK